MPTRAPGLALLLLIVVGVSSCRSPEPQGEPVPSDLQGAVLILLDTLRADHVGCYGSSRPTTPNLDLLARRGLRFDQTVASSPWTLPSVAAMLTGTDPHRALKGWRIKWSLVERLRDGGFVTAAFTEGGYVSRKFGFDLGFDDYEEEEGAVQFREAGDPRNPDPLTGIGHTFSVATQWIREHRDQKFFVFIHTFEPHTPYTNGDFADGMDRGRLGPTFPIGILTRLQSGSMVLSDDEIEYVKALYDGDILNSDRHVGELLGVLEELGLRDRTLVVVTGDHGEELNDHYRLFTGDHGHSLKDPLVMVPLILHDPRRCDTGREISTQVRLIDVMPTVADLLGVPIDESLDGASLLPVMDGEETKDRIAFATMTRRGPRRVGVRGMGFKLIVTIGPGRDAIPLRPSPPGRQLYDLAEDPREKTNLAADRPELASALNEVLVEKNTQRTEETEEVPVPVDAKLRERLRSLGYID